LGCAGLDAAAGVGAATVSDSAAGVAALVAAGLLDPQPTSIARVIAIRGVDSGIFTFVLRSMGAR
jgi:hypothetical protein